MKKFNELEEVLGRKYQNLPLFIKGPDEKNYISRENFIKLMELELDGPTND